MPSEPQAAQSIRSVKAKSIQVLYIQKIPIEVLRRALFRWLAQSESVAVSRMQTHSQSSAPADASIGVFSATTWPSIVRLVRMAAISIRPDQGYERHFASAIKSA